MLTTLGYVADAWILATYAFLAKRRKPLPFHWANAIGGLPLLVAEYRTSLWQVMVLTGAFTALGWFGLATEYRIRRTF